MLVRAVEPVAETRGGLVGGLAIERHHRCRHARYPDDVRAPAFFGDPCHFNDKRSTRNSSFELVPHDGVWIPEVLLGGSSVILRIARRETSETKYEGRLRPSVRNDSRGFL